ncbi:hypothetical protein TNCV_1057131 [Trichonephila clavipes]|nr:hypothetical protein TNCV_1057131 [Trichonephila clavipes]
MCWYVVIQKIPVFALSELMPLTTNGFPQTTSSRSFRLEDDSNSACILLSENESNSGQLSYSNLDSDEYIRLSESDCKASKRADENIPVNLDIYAARESTEWITHDSNAPGRFSTQNVLR